MLIHLKGIIKNIVKNKKKIKNKISRNRIAYKLRE